MSLQGVVAPYLAPSGYGRLWDLAWTILNRTETLLAGTAAGVPARCYVAVGDPSAEFSTDTLCVELVTIRSGEPGLPVPRPVDNQTTFAIEYVIHVWREMPPQSDDHGNPLTTADLNSVAQKIYSDGNAVLFGIVPLILNDAFLDPQTLVQILSVDKVSPLGGITGWDIHLEVSSA